MIDPKCVKCNKTIGDNDDRGDLECAAKNGIKIILPHCIDCALELLELLGEHDSEKQEANDNG